MQTHNALDLKKSMGVGNNSFCKGHMLKAKTFKRSRQMRLIDADALIKRLNEIGAPYRADINNAIAEAPTADAVEVVRCKDCYWYDKGKNDCDSWEWCKRHKFDSYDEGFCSWATHKKQVTSKLKKPCDSLLTEDSEERKEQKSKLDLISRQDAIEAVRLESAKHLLLGRGDILDILYALPRHGKDG